MMLSVEISLYPLHQEYKPIINAFLDDINSQKQAIEIRTSNMSTRLFGEYDEVMSLLHQAMKHSMQTFGKMVFVCKFVEGDTRELKNYD